MLRLTIPALAALMLAPAVAPAFAQENLYFCYCVAESSDNKLAAISEVFEWRGTGPAPQNAMNGEYTKLAQDEIGPTKWTSCSASKDETQIVQAQANEFKVQGHKGKRIIELDYSY